MNKSLKILIKYADIFLRLPFIIKGDLLPNFLLNQYSNTASRWSEYLSVLEVFYCFVQEKSN